MARFHLIGLGVFTLLHSLAARACAQFEPVGLSAFEQAAAADVIVTGKVTDIERDPILVERTNRTAKVLHLVATIRVDENLLGAKGLTHLRVAFVSETPAPARDPNVKIYL
jgi:hypothetical protein